MWRPIAAVIGATVLCLAPVAASAQSCPSIRLDQSAINGHLLQLVADHPGANIVVGLCWNGASQGYARTHDATNAAATFGLCAAVGCAIAGGGQCANVMGEWVGAALRYQILSEQAQALRCD